MKNEILEYKRCEFIAGLEQEALLLDVTRD
jgi:hypothetical protein